MTREEANKKNAEWLANWVNYADDHKHDIQQMQDTIDQLLRAGLLEVARCWPILSPTEKLTLAARLEILRRNGVNSLLSIHFTPPGEVPDLQGLTPPVVDTRSRGFVPPSLGGLDQTEGFAKSDPRLTYGLPGFPAADPSWKQFAKLPPSTATPQEPLVVQFHPETGSPHTFMDGRPVMGPAPSSQVTPYDKAAATLTGLAGLGLVAPQLLPWLVPLGIAATSGGAFASPARHGGTGDASVFSTGTGPYNPFDNPNGSGDNRSRSPTEDKTLGHEPAGSPPTQISGGLGAQDPGAASAVRPEDVRRLTRVNASNAANLFESGSAPVPYLSSSPFKGGGLGNGSVPLPGQQSSQAGGPGRVSAGEPSSSIPPEIWELLAQSGMHGQDAEEWLSRWIRSRMPPE